MEAFNSKYSRKWAKEVSNVFATHLKQTPPPKGKRMSPEPTSGYLKPWQPSVRQIPNPNPLVHRFQSLKVVPFHPLPRADRRQMKHFKPVYSTENLFKPQRKPVVQNGIRAVDSQAKEFTLENHMTRKKSPTDIRNGISRSTLGDKPYGAVTYSPDFYKQDGLIVGQTHARNMKQTFSRKNETNRDFMFSYAGTSPDRQTWRNRRRRESLAEEIAEVEALPENPAS